MTADSLRLKNRRDLEALARRQKLTGIREMSKDELVAALVHPPQPGSKRRTVAAQGVESSARKRSAAKKDGKAVAARKSAAITNRPARNDRTATGRRSVTAGANGRNAAANGSRSGGSSSSTRANGGVLFWAAPEGQDRLFSSAVDAHWFDVHWSVTAGMLRRAEAFFGPDWRRAAPIIRIFDVTSDDSSVSARTLVRDERISAQANRWFIHVDRSDRTWLFEIGLLGPSDRYFPLAHGAPVATAGPLSPSVRQFAIPSNGHHGTENGRNGHANGDAHSTRSKKHRFHSNGTAALSQPPGISQFSPAGYSGLGAYASSASSLIPASVRAAHRDAGRRGETDEKREEPGVVQLHAEVIVHGTTDPQSELRLMKDRIPLNSEGTFSLKIPLENGRVVIPIEHVSADGSEQRTVILAIERSTRVLETQLLDETAD